MPAPHRRLVVALAVAGWLVLPASSASAAVDGPCTVTLNGVEVDRIDTISSPLELGAEDTLVLRGTDPEGTTGAVVEVAIMMITLDSETVTYQASADAFDAELDLAALSPYAVGLFRVRGTTDHCTAEAWLRVTGRLPLATLVGLAATGVAVGGAAVVIGAIISRRRYSPLTAALGGLVAGLGGAMLGQAFGLLQISFVSLGLTAGTVAIAGFLPAWFRRERPGQREAGDIGPPFHHQEAPGDAATADPGAGHGDEESKPPATREAAQSPDATAPETDREQVAETADAPPRVAAYWCYVMGGTEVVALGDHDTVVASLEPGTWYLAKREVGEWAHVVVRDGLEGWVPRTAVHRQG